MVTTKQKLKLGTYSIMSTPGSDAKSIHGQEIGLLTGVLYMAPSDISGRINVCAYASAGCRESCLFTAGHAGIIKTNETTNAIIAARINRTLLFTDDRSTFWFKLVHDLTQLEIDAKRNEMLAAARLNGTSDLPWEKIRVLFYVGSIKIEAANIFEMFPNITFYDYTAYPYAKRPTESLPANYSLTFSRKETTTDQQVADELAHGRNVAIVFATVNSRDKVTGAHLHALPETYLGTPVINGDINDVRFYDPTGSIVGLRAKGKARKDKSGFVVAGITS